MKKKVLSAVLAGAMVVSLAACGGSSDTAETATGAAGESGAETVAATSDDENTLTLYAWDKNFNIPAMEAAAEDYKNNVNPDFNLEIIEQSQSSDIEDAITLAASAGDYSTLPDIVLFQDHWINKYVADYPDAFQDINEADIDWDDFAQEKLSYSTINDLHYGVPVDNGTVVAAYRTDILEEAGYTIDDLTGCSWAEFIEIGKAVYEKTGKYLLSMDGDGNDLPYMMLQAEGESQFKDGAINIKDNATFKAVIETMKEMVDNNVLYLANDWSDYTDQTIVGDMVAGVINGNWIIPTIEQVEENSGKWEITSMPTLNGGEGYASNGGSSLYITGNCQKKELAVDFLAKTFGAGSTETYDAALTNGGVITCSSKAGESEVYAQGVAYFNDQPIYQKIVEMGANVQPIEQNDYHYTVRTQVAAAIQNIIGGADVDQSISDASDQIEFAMEG